MDTLASIADVEAALGRSLSNDEEARIDAILEKASALFRQASGQQFTEGSSRVRLKVNGGRVFLPQRPVVEVISVESDNGISVDYSLFGQWLTVPKRSHEFLIVEYEHGGVVPDLVRLTIADVARQVLMIDPNASTGVTQYSETTGPFTNQYTYANWALGGATRLAPDDVRIAESFRVKVPTVWVQQP